MPDIAAPQRRVRFTPKAGIGWLGFGRNAEQKVVYVAESLTDVVLIFFESCIFIRFNCSAFSSVGKA